jgi:hypothetical protein
MSRKYVGGVVLVGLAAVVVSHGTILRQLARVLIVDQREEEVGLVAILRGEGRHEVAARMLGLAQCRRILVFEGESTQLIRDGISPASSVISIMQLKQHGVKDNEIAVLEGETKNDWEKADQLSNWLAKHPGDRLAILCTRFGSRRLRLILDQTLPADERIRVSVRALHDRRYDESNWWQRRTGCKEFFGESLRLGYCWAAGRPVVGPEPWDPDTYERQLLATMNQTK